MTGTGMLTSDFLFLSRTLVNYVDGTFPTPLWYLGLFNGTYLIRNRGRYGGSNIKHGGREDYYNEDLVDLDFSRGSALMLSGCLNL